MNNRKCFCIFVIFCTWIYKLNASINLALRKPTRQSSVANGRGPDLVVDGNFRNSGDDGAKYCIQTLANNRQVWWQVDFGQISQIKNVGVLYREGYEGSLSGVKFYLSNDRNWWDGKMCSPSAQKLPARFNFNCPATARYLTVYNDRNFTVDAYLDLCEVQVLGCPVGKHGQGNCNSDCQMHYCKACDPDNGLCIACKDGFFGSLCHQTCQIPNCRSCEKWNGTTCSVCEDKFSGSTCQECANGRYGQRCDKQCPRYCLGDKCQRDTGHCTDGCVTNFNGSTCEECEDGRYGFYCDSFCQLSNCKACGRWTGTACTKCMDNFTGPQCQSCVVGMYGTSCIQKCPVNCRDTCDRYTGNCNNGCKDGWSGLRCEECAVGRYGQFCNKICPENCAYGQCHTTTGQCLNGCKDGWTGNFCHDCSEGYFGKQCTSRCHCRYGACYKNDGICMTRGCVAGYTGLSCNITCPDGMYGLNCAEKCHCQNGQCNKTSGQCPPGGCKAGYHGSACDQVCPDGTYGVGCSGKCHCLNGPCDKIAGACPLGGCKAGYQGFSCNQECAVGSFGSNCASKCHCRYGYCNKVTGTCYQGGCLPGYLEPTCSQTCNRGYYGDSCRNRCFCKNDTCDHVTGRCPIGGCQNGFLGLNCNVLCRDGFFGPECNMSCYCANGPCDKGSGKCPPGGCKFGWQGSTCNQRCSDGYFGQGCTERCYCKSGPCDSLTGQCIHGECRDGFMGPTCSSVCISETFGPNCSKECHCKDKHCPHDTGICSSGICQDGWIGKTCSEACPLGRYGSGCQYSCKNCIGQTCNRFNGSCASGCEEGWRGLKCDTHSLAVASSGGPAGDMVPIFAGAIVGVLVLITIILIVVLVIRRRRKKLNSSKTGENASRNLSLENLTDDSEGSPEGTIHVYTNPALSLESDVAIRRDDIYQNTNDYYNIKGNDIHIDELRNLIQRKTGDDSFKDEYNILPVGLVHPHDVSLKPENKLKNRFITVFSYDHSRVILDKRGKKDQSDYINANYIDGVDVHREYIATQGPRKNTLEDFWRMVWETKCGKVVMLTGLIENGKVKCERYWPTSDAAFNFEYLRIEMKDENEYSFYTKRTLKLHNKETDEQRILYHYHFTTWPDHGTPDPLQLVVFHRHVSEDLNELTGPMVVHCSAGIGRTGTFIALDALFRYGQKTERIDILEYVKTMRKDRMNMIQTLDQYIFLHDALLEAFTYKDTAIKNQDFLDVYKKVLEEPKNQNRIRLEFQTLQAEKRVYPEGYYKSSLEPVNRDKNRGDVYAHERYRPFLISFDTSRNNYINAVALQSTKYTCGYIATHFPLESTVADFWCLVYDHSNAVVIFETASEEMSCLPVQKNELNIDPFTIKKLSEKSDENNVTELQFSLQHKMKTSTKRVTVYKAKLPPNDNRSSMTKLLLQLSDVVENNRALIPPITVVCPDGVLYCGIFCTINSVIQRIQMDKVVDIFHTVKELQIRRPEFIGSLEQYQLCYETIKEYFDSQAVYMNT